MARARIYLDNAATSWPKPEGVYKAVQRYERELGAPAGRGVYREAIEVDEAIRATRKAVADLLGVSASEQIIFTLNGTDSLNLAIRGTLKPGDHVVTTVVEHNSVLRPLRWLEDRGEIQVTRVGCDSVGLIDPNEIEKSLRPETKLIILIHASNVVGTIQPASEVGKIAREHGVLFLVDAAQTLGHIPVSVEHLNADLLASPGHKGLLGPSGTGILYIRPGLEELVDCVKQGGTGSVSFDDRHPLALPYKYEAGSHNVSGLLGLCAGIDYLNQRGIGEIRRHRESLTARLLDGLSSLSHVTVYGPKDPSKQVGVVSVTLAGAEPSQAAAFLDKHYRIQVRAGFQCAALLHRALGTFEQGGTVRFSVGPFSTEGDVDAAVEAMAAIAGRDTRQIVGPVACPCVEAARVSCVRSQPATCLPASVRAPEDAASHVPPAANLDELIPGLRTSWEKTLGDPEVTIAVLDGPVDLSHPSLKRASITQVPSPAGLVRGGARAARHGTHVASVIFGQHDGPIKGIAPRCRGLIVPIFFDGPDGSIVPCSQIHLGEAINLAVRHGANVINVSAGQFSPFGASHPLLSDAVRACARHNVLVVSAAGNDGCECLHVPGALPSVLAVGAMNRQGEPIDFSNWGPAYRTNGVLALGEGVLGAIPGDGVAANTGTSFAAPIVSGVAGLLLSLQRKSGLTPSAHRVRNAIIKSALGCEHTRVPDCRRLLAGRLNVAGAMSLITKGELAMIETQLPNDGISSEPNAAPGASTAGAAMQQAREPRPAREGNARDAQPPRVTGNPQPEALTPAQHAPQSVHVAPTCLPIQPAATGINPLECGCAHGNHGELVYAVGDLAIDFGSQARQDSIQQHAETFNADGGRLNVGLNGHLLRHLLGWRETYGGQHDDHRPHRYDAKAVIWVLRQDESPVYAICPTGPFAEDAFLEIAEFLMEQEGYPVEEKGRKLKHDDADLYASLDTVDGKEPKRLVNKRGIPIRRVERVAIPGRLNGTVKLLNGTEVPAIEPDMRGTLSWSLPALVELVVKHAGLEDSTQEKSEDKRLRANLERINQRFLEEVRNRGLTPEERSLNFVATQIYRIVPFLRDKFAVGFEPELDSVSVRPSPTCRIDSECYDVEVAFFDPENVLRSKMIQAQTVDVSDVVPVLLGEVREYRRR